MLYVMVMMMTPTFDDNDESVPACFEGLKMRMIMKMIMMMIMMMIKMMTTRTCDDIDKCFP